MTAHGGLCPDGSCLAQETRPLRKVTNHVVVKFRSQEIRGSSEAQFQLGVLHDQVITSPRMINDH